MCRTTEHYRQHKGGDEEEEEDRLKMAAFNLRLSLSSPADVAGLLPDSLTLVFLPRINAAPLEVNGSKIRPDSPAFLTLHRLATTSDAVFAARDKVTACDGLIFEVHLAQHRLLRGIFRGRDGDAAWRLECKCVLQGDIAGVDISQAEVSVAIRNGRRLVRETAVADFHSRPRRRCRAFRTGLEEIPEERDRDVSSESDDGEGGSCCCCHAHSADTITVTRSRSSESDDDNPDGDGPDGLVEMDMMEEGVRWAADVGFWVVCLGVGFLVSRASAKRLSRRGHFFLL